MFLAAATVCGWQLPRLRFSHDTRALLRADPAADRLEAQLAEQFGSEDLLLVAWEVDDALTPELKAALLELLPDYCEWELQRALRP